MNLHVNLLRKNLSKFSLENVLKTPNEIKGSCLHSETASVMSPLEIEFQQKFHKTEISMHESRRHHRHRRFCNFKMEKCMA